MTHASLLDICSVWGALFLASNVWFFVRVLRPIHKLSVLATQLSRGELDSFDCRCGGIPEIGVLHRTMSSMVGHVKRAQAQSRAYTEGLAEGQENDRKRIARELHDDTVQAIIAITHSIDMARNWVKTDQDHAIQILQIVREQAVAIVTSLRNLIGDLRPPALEELGLIPALEMQFNIIQPADITLTTCGEPRRLDEIQELTLFRATQEALRNVMRHSHAQRIGIKLDYQPNGVTLHIQDNGCGFCPPPHLGELALQHHFGLIGIQERVTSLGGWFDIDSEIGKGTMLKVYLPTVAQNQPDNDVRDPVCSTLIDPQQAYGSILYQNETYYFCCPVCQGSFQKNSDLYLDKVSSPVVAMEK